MARCKRHHGKNRHGLGTVEWFCILGFLALAIMMLVGSLGDMLTTDMNETADWIGEVGRAKNDPGTQPGENPVGNNDSQNSSGTDKKDKKVNGNNGLGNGEDPPPPGNAPENDGPGTSPGNPGAKGGWKSGR